jgi:hypothetical protein
LPTAFRRYWCSWREELARLSAANADVILRKRIEMALDRGFGEQHLSDPRIAGLCRDARDWRFSSSWRGRCC